MKETKARLAGTGVAVHDVELFRMDPALEPESFLPGARGDRASWARTTSSRSCPIRTASGRPRASPRLCDLAKPLGIFVEPRISALDRDRQPGRGGARSCARSIGRNAGILIDMLHFGRSRFEPRRARQALPREWFRFAHVCDAAKEVPPTMAGIIHTARDERLFPGEGGIDVRGILARMPQDIPYALEIPRVALTRAVGRRKSRASRITVARSHLDDGAGTGEAHDHEHHHRSAA